MADNIVESTHTNQHNETDIIQWNINGYYTRYQYLKILINTYLPLLLCLQETNFKDNNQRNLKGYKKFQKNRSSYAHASGGVVIYVKDDLQASESPILSNIETIAIQVNIRNKIHIRNIYLPNSHNFTQGDLQNIIH